ncbi:hypothetical protein [Hydrogenobacter sp. Uz 6-8]|jgi:hypothetical protein|uniref:hypothetical protein n=1 Tax=Hydrogenobacter sp. Uz 6-8 TaxID=3384828 RepID=UPI000F145467|nr:MAG: hypothetical protein D6804_00935 [Aquificota bacterium]
MSSISKGLRVWSDTGKKAVNIAVAGIKKGKVLRKNPFIEAMRKKPDMCPRRKKGNSQCHEGEGHPLEKIQARRQRG